MLRKLLVLVSVVFLVGSSVSADEETMAHIKYHFVDQNGNGPIPAIESYEVWFLGSETARVEQAPDRPNGSLSLFITVGADAWSINGYTRSGKHSIDPGPTFDFHMPIFAHLEAAHGKLDGLLEIGSEMNFFRERNAIEKGQKEYKGMQYDVFQTEQAGATLTLYLDKTTGKPRFIFCEDQKNHYGVEYTLYETDLPADKSLFQPPDDVEIIEGNFQERVNSPCIGYLTHGFDGRDWIEANTGMSETECITEFVLKGEDIENWSELVTVNGYGFAYKKGIIRSVFEYWQKNLMESCPKVDLTVLEESDTTIVVEWNSSACSADGEAQYELMRYVAYRQGGLFRIAYTAKDQKTFKKQKKTWLAMKF